MHLTPAPTAQEQPSKHPLWAIVLRIVVGIPMALLGGVFLLAGLGFTLVGSGDTPWTWFLLILVWAPLTLVGGVQFGLHYRMGPRLAALSAPLFLAWVVLADDGSAGKGLLVLLVTAVLSVLIVFNPPVLRYFETGKTLNWSRATKVRVAVGALIPALVIVVLQDFESIKHDFALARYEANCEDGDMDACGRLAQALLQGAKSVEDAERGMGLMTDLCAKDVHAACRFMAYMHAPSYHDQLEGAREIIYAALVENAVNKCVEGEARGCWVARIFLDRVTDVDLLMRASAKACDDGKPWACQALLDLKAERNADVDPADEARWKSACAAGQVDVCAFHSKGEGVPDEERLEWMELACAADASAPVCGRRAQLLASLEDPTSESAARQACHDGHLEACELVEIDETAPHAQVQKRVYEALSTMTLEDEEADRRTRPYYRDPTLRMARMPAIEGVLEACDEGVSIACFALGLNLLGELQGTIPPRLPLYESLESSLGRACKEGVNASCVVLGSVLLDRPFGETRRVKEANAWLEHACAQKHRIACWMKDFQDELAAGQIDGWRAAAEGMCAASSAVGSPICRELAGIWAHDIGAAPWTFSERLGYAELRRACEHWGSRRTCVWTGNLLAETNSGVAADGVFPPWHVTAMTLNEKMCVSGKYYDWTCERADWHALVSDYVSKPERAAMRTRMCDARPQIEWCQAEPESD